MTDYVAVNCQIPSPWLDKLESVATIRNQSLSVVVQDAIAQYLGESNLTTNKDVEDLRVQILTLQQQFDNLKAHVEVKDKQLLTLATINQIKPQLLPHLPTAISDEEVYEDEPDEVLYDFLEPEYR